MVFTLVSTWIRMRQIAFQNSPVFVGGEETYYGMETELEGKSVWPCDAFALVWQTTSQDEEMRDSTKKVMIVITSFMFSLPSLITAIFVCLFAGIRIIVYIVPMWIGVDIFFFAGYYLIKYGTRLLYEVFVLMGCASYVTYITSNASYMLSGLCVCCMNRCMKCSKSCCKRMSEKILNKGDELEDIVEKENDPDEP